MARKLFTVDVEDENLTNSASSKTTTLVKSSAEKEVENYGIVKINNNSSKNRVKNTKDLGFEKNTSGAQKKSVKTTVSVVDDYFDFSFRPTAKTELKPAPAKKCKKIDDATKKEITEIAMSCERNSFDERAQSVVSVARMGSLFE